MTAVTRLWDEVRVLTGGTMRAWRSLLPLLLLLQVIAWFSYEGSMAMAAWVASDHPWLALGIFAIGFVLSLMVAVLMMRTVGDHIGSGAMVPESVDEPDDKVDLQRMLALTMLPLLATYAAFGYVSDAVNQLTLMSFAYYGSMGDNLMTLLSPKRAGVFTVIGFLVGAYVLRRILDLLQQRTGWRFLGILVTITEAFFVMGLVIAASRWISDLQFWLRTRQFRAWWDAAIDGLATAFSVIHLDLPAFLQWMGPLWQDHLFPALVQAITEPLLWLAVAALVFGSRVLSVAELWRKGQPLISYVPGSDKLRLTRRMAATAEVNHGRGLGRRAMAWTQENLLGDIDDKYIPTIHALRLVLKAGLPFLAAFLITYNVIALAKAFFTQALLDAVGGHDILFWLGTLPGIHLIVDLPLETLRLTLLAVAFHRCLELFRSQAHPADGPVPAPMPRRRPSVLGAVGRWRRLRGSLIVVLAGWLVAGIGWAFAGVLQLEQLDYRDGKIDETVSLGRWDVSVIAVEYGRVLGPDQVARTPGRWVKVTLRSSAPGPGGAMLTELRSSNKVYSDTGSGLQVLGDGQWMVTEAIFEIDPEDIGDLELIVHPSYETVVRAAAARIDLGMSREDAARVRESSTSRVVNYDMYRNEYGGN